MTKRVQFYITFSKSINTNEMKLLCSVIQNGVYMTEIQWIRMGDGVMAMRYEATFEI